jgi:hypothetical protein
MPSRNFRGTSRDVWNCSLYSKCLCIYPTISRETPELGKTCLRNSHYLGDESRVVLFVKMNAVTEVTCPCPSGR